MREGEGKHALNNSEPHRGDPPHVSTDPLSTATIQVSAQLVRLRGWYADYAAQALGLRSGYLLHSTPAAFLIPTVSPSTIARQIQGERAAANVTKRASSSGWSNVVSRRSDFSRYAVTLRFDATRTAYGLWRKN